ncbi:MAG: 2-oxoacid:acceptor oxidoreductase family protein [Desulfobacterales bacterium]
MQEIRFHGRGGQGTVVASVVLAKAFFRAGYYVQTFPVFGVERRGAPVEAYLRLDDKKILIRSNVYHPDLCCGAGCKLLHTVDVTKGTQAPGWILVSAGYFRDSQRFPFSAFRLACSGCLRHCPPANWEPDTTIINTSMIGAFAGCGKSAHLEKPGRGHHGIPAGKRIILRP